MNSVLTSFVEELREIGIPVSMVETFDAADALVHTDLTERENLRAALGATLVKDANHYHAFDAAFDVYFGGTGTISLLEGAMEDSEDGIDGLRQSVVKALLEDDRATLRRIVGAAVDRFAGMQPGRPVGGRYYTYRVMHQLDADDLLVRLLAALATPYEASDFDEALVRDRVERMIEALRGQVDSEVTARLVADRGAHDVAVSRRLPLLEDIDLMHATRLEIEQIERVVGPLARKLATRLSQRRRHGRKGRLDVRRTIRRSLGHGGVLIDPRFKPPRVAKPEIVILCDVSGSMATFARFTLQLTYAISTELRRVRAFAFIDGLDEVTEYFASGTRFADALVEMSTKADLVRRDGHSDYGTSFAEMVEHHLDAITARTTLIITGDARNNYRPTGVHHLATMTRKARATFWLNPEPERFWDTGDSVLGSYRDSCDRVESVRTLRELERFVERAALPTVSRS